MLKTIILSIFFTIAFSAPAFASGALTRLTQDRILTPLPHRPSDLEADCAAVVQADIQKFYSEEKRQNIDSKNEELTASVFVDSTENSLYGQYIALRLNEKNKIGEEKESARATSRDFFSANAFKFFPKKISETAKYVILDPNGQIEGLGFEGIRKFIDCFRSADSIAIFQAYGMDSIYIAAQGKEGAARPEDISNLQWSMALNILEYMANHRGLRKMHLYDLSYNAPSLLKRRGLTQKLDHMGLSFPASTRVSDLTLGGLENSALKSLTLEYMTIYDSKEFTSKLGGISQLALHGVIFDPQVSHLHRHLSLIDATLLSFTGYNIRNFSNDPARDLQSARNLTHLNLTNRGFQTPEVDTNQVAEIFESLPKITHFAFTAPQVYNSDALLKIISTFRSPSLREVGITNFPHLDETVQREGLPPIRVVGNSGIHW